jgi:alpha-tubulin suppressor-like RCC1 family protein
VTPEQVKSAASAFIASRYPAAGPAAGNAPGTSRLRLGAVEAVTEQGGTVGYVANLDSAGYVLMRADDRLPPIKMYSDNGTFAGLPPEFLKVIRFELAGELKALSNADAKRIPVVPQFAGKWAALLSPTDHLNEVRALASPAPSTVLLATTWDQNDPYNWYAPTAAGGPGGRAWAGCGATAMAQILRYHSEPVRPPQNHTYTDSLGYCTGTHSFSDVGMGDYNWGYMPSYVLTTSPSEQKQEVGRLLYHCGVALDSNFEADVTTGSFPQPPIAFSYLGYTSGPPEMYGTAPGYSGSFTRSQWYAKVAADIDAYKPIFYAMTYPSGGHAVVCDGYRNSSEIHLNFGWANQGGGFCNAWYNIDNVSVGSESWTLHIAVFGITPPSASEGVMWGAGYNAYGQLGLVKPNSTGDNYLSDTTSRNSFAQAPIISGLVGGAAGGSHSLGVRADGTVVAVGNNLYGQLGLGNNTTPVGGQTVPSLANVVAVAAGDSHSLALTSDGAVWATGLNSYGQLGLGNNTNCNTFTQVSGLTNVTAIACGCNYSLALKGDGTVWGAGYNANGQLGLGNNTTRNSFAQATGLSGVAAIACGGNHSLALKNDGTLWTAGDNTYGQLGLGNNTAQNRFTQVTSVTGVMTMAGGGYHSLAVKGDGTLWTTGYNYYGALGSGNTTARTSFAVVTGMSNVYSVAAGDHHSLALKTNGSIWGAGYNAYGQLGIGNTTSKTTFTQASVPTNATGIVCGKIAGGLGTNHSIALTGNSPITTTTTTLSTTTTTRTTTSTISVTTTTMLYHPADTNYSATIVIGEVTAYGAAWKSGATWSVGPVPIPIGYMTRAGYLWKGGEAYHYDRTVDATVWPTNAAVWVTGAP